MRRLGTVLLGIALFASACPRPPAAPPAPPSPPPPSEAERALGAARAALASDDDRQALRKLAAVVDGWPEAPAAAEALWLIGVLRVDPQSRVRDLRAARAVFARLAAEYPESPEAAAARGFVAVLRDRERCDEDVAALRAETARLRETVDAMRRLDLELERRP
ncbi:MAG: hypothetical protein KIT14_09735 [bacterium]|nr:hypothetical protein [bacterium]